MKIIQYSGHVGSRGRFLFILSMTVAAAIGSMAWWWLGHRPRPTPGATAVVARDTLVDITKIQTLPAPNAPESLVELQTFTLPQP